MKIKNELINVNSFDFRKSKEITKKNKIRLGGIIFILSLLDITGTYWSLNNQIKSLEQKTTSDLMEYTTLRNSHKEFKEKKTDKITVDVESIKKGFDNFKPQTSVGELLLLSEILHFKNEYYKLNPDNPYTEKQGIEIQNYLDKTISKEMFNKGDFAIQCSYHISCHILKYSFNDELNQHDNTMEMAKRKRFFELSHKEEMLEFYKLPITEQQRRYETKKDPFSKNFW